MRCFRKRYVPEIVHAVGRVPAKKGEGTRSFCRAGLAGLSSAGLGKWGRRSVAIALLPMVMILNWSAAGHAADRPNILWIFSEDLSPFMGCYDDPVNSGHTPVIDSIAQRGVLFKRAYMPAPVCSACRSAIITGVMQTTTGTHHHRSGRFTDGEVVPEALQIPLPAGMKTIPELMREAGYFTFNSGKDDYNFHYNRRDLYTVGNEPGYEAGMNGWQGNRAVHALSITEDTWNARPDKSQPWFGQIELKGGKANAKYVREGELLKPTEVPQPPYFPDTPALQKAWTMHYNSARGADVNVESILKQLKADGELENTIVFFFSDHGSNHSLRHKQFCYEGGVHVPLMMMGDHPALVAGTVRDEIITGLDIPATTLAMAGVPLPDYLDGQDLFSESYQPQEFVVSARDRCDYTIDRIRTVRSDRFRYLRNFFPERSMSQAQYRDNKPMVKSMRKAFEDGKMTDYQAEHWFGDRPEEELYDMEADPHQINNLAGDPNYADQLAKHREHLNQWIEKTDDKGQYPEDREQLKATYEFWKDRPVFINGETNPEYDQFRENADEPATEAAPAADGTAAPASKPNIVLFFVDDMGWADLGYRQPKFESPNIDALIAEGLDFQQAYIACPTCSPSRATLLTGLHPARMKMVRHIPNDKKHGFDEHLRTDEKWNYWEKDPSQFPCPNWLDLEYTTYAEALHDLGYYNQFVGKWHLGHEPYHPIHQGFDAQFGTSNHGHPNGYNPPYFKGSEVFKDEKERYLTDKLTDGAVDFIENYDRDQPFMLSFWYYSVHGPHDGRPDLLKHFQEQGLKGKMAHYAAMVKAVDESVGRVREAINARGLDDNTVIIFLSDQGGAFDNPPFRGGKKKEAVYEGGARVPLAIRWPGVTKSGTQNNSVVQSTDLFPTFIEMAGGDVSKFGKLDGVSLIDTIQENSTLERGEPIYGFRAYEDLYGTVRDGDMKLIAYRSGDLKLFNIADDIGETSDIADANPEVVRRMADQLYMWEKEMQVDQYSGVKKALQTQ